MSYLYIILAFMALAVFSVLSYKRKLYDVCFDGKNRKHKLMLATGVGICLVVAIYIFFSIYKEIAYEYPFTGLLRSHNAYEQLFDAFMKKQFHLDVPVSDTLLELPNPYDTAQRNSEQVSYLWDRAYYNGKYYSYFGIAPIIMIYFPFYFLTGKVPTPAVVCFIFAVIGLVAIAFLVVQATRLLCKKVNLCLLFFSLLAVESGSLLFMLEVSADMYYTAVISAVCNLALTLLFVFTAFLEKKSRKKNLCFFFAGVFLVLTVMSRPNVALLGGITAPLFLHLIFSKKIMLRDKAIRLVSFAVPVAVGAAIQMYYNYVRFDSMLDFGAAYQLTVCDVSSYVVTSALFIPSLHHYFFQMPDLKNAFPFFRLSMNQDYGSWTGYIYTTRMCGAMFFPSVWTFFALPFIAVRKQPWWKTAVLLLGIAGPIGIAFINTCIAGVNIRYLADIMLVLVLISSIILLDTFNFLNKGRAWKRFTAFIVISLILVATSVVGFLFIVENERFSLFK